MTLRTAGTRVRIRPQETGSWSTLSDAAADKDTRALILDDLEISWSRPTPRDHPDPGSIRFTLRVPLDSPDADLIAYDAEIHIESQLQELREPFGIWWNVDLLNPWITIGRGWISSWHRSKPHAKADHWLYTVDAVDILGRAAAVNIAAEPWPAQHGNARLAAINAASPVGPLAHTTGLEPALVLARDVDNAPALDVIRETAPLGKHAVDRGTGLISLEVNDDTSPSFKDDAMHVGGHASLVSIPARLIEDQGRRMDRAGTLNAASATFADSWIAPEHFTTTYRASGYATARWSIATDAVYLNVPAVTAWLKAIVDESNRPGALVIEPGRILLSQDIEVPWMWRLVASQYRYRAVVEILDHPADVDKLQAVTAGTLTIRGRKLTLSVQLLPARLAGIRPMAFADLPRDTRRPTFKPYPVQYVPPLRTRIKSTRAITFSTPQAQTS